MARISDNILPTDSNPYLTLDRYQEIMRLPIAAFNGLNRPEEIPQYECSNIWCQSERDYLAIHLLQAEEMREKEIGYHLAPKYLEEDYQYDIPLVLDHKHLVEIGEETSADVDLAYALDHGVETDPNDPVVISIVTALTDASEIKVYYPGESIEIHPSSVAISAGTLTINIPRSRLVKPELNDNRENHLSYFENDHFLETVDVKRVYYDEAEGIDYVWEGWQLSSSTLTESTQSAWPDIRDARLAIVDALPASYSAGVWTHSQLSHCVHPRWIRIKYVSGISSSMMAEIQTARLSHTLMPNKPCSCPTVHMYWQEDKNPDSSGIMTPYGGSVGAMFAWLADSRSKIGTGGKFPRPRIGAARPCL